MGTKFTKSEIKKALESKLSRCFGVQISEATKEQIYKSAVMTVKDILMQQRSEFREKAKNEQLKRVYYICIEFLVGKSLKNNLMNLNIEDKFRDVISDLGYSIEEMYEIEPDPGLGNGGLGRLAACFMDSLTTCSYPATGYSICYEYGLFKQKIIDGIQVELPDAWFENGDVWLVPRSDKKCTVKIGGRISENWENGKLNIIHTEFDEVTAVPYDLLISGVNGEAVNVLRLFKAEDSKTFNMDLFSQGQFARAVENNTNAEIISKVLYPSDNHTEGKLLRLTQQYFLASASLQCIIKDHLSAYGTLANFSEKNAIHINDTHPALCIPELMRILIDIYSYSWEDAWKVVCDTVSYTNHTVMPEALEIWNEELFRIKLPRIYGIICEINRRLCEDLWSIYPGDWGRISHLSIIAYSQIKMANLALLASHKVNGVSELHSEILKNKVFSDFYKLYPEKFTNVTNGITFRRWLCYSNKRLANLIDECIGDGYRLNYEKISDLAKFADDKGITEKVGEIKKENKIDFSNYIASTRNINIDPNSIFDTQAKRLHEYKRQLLNVLHIIGEYIYLLNNPNADYYPRTFLFGAKAAPSYKHAKEIIRLICKLSDEIEKNKKVSEKLKVVFLEDYNVSLAERLIPATDISEQISLAGYEASGTGNMKFMLNGSITIGTADGANIEIFDRVGEGNYYSFGLNAREAEEMWRRGYRSSEYYINNSRLRSIIDALTVGFNGQSFSHISQYLISGGSTPDPYMCLADFESYSNAHSEMTKDYLNKDKWNRISLLNTASAGYFSSDRSVKEYAEKIWDLKSVKHSDNITK